MFPPGGPYPHPEPPDRGDETEPALPDAESFIDPFLHDPVLLHRARTLAREGMIAPQARSLALDRSVDVHWVVERLLKRGCPPDTAFLIASN